MHDGYDKCLLTLQEETYDNTWLMGDPFLRKYYSIYDMDNAKIGLVGVASSTRKYFEQESIGFPEESVTEIVA